MFGLIFHSQQTKPLTLSETDVSAIGGPVMIKRQPSLNWVQLHGVI